MSCSNRDTSPPDLCTMTLLSGGLQAKLFRVIVFFSLWDWKPFQSCSFSPTSSSSFLLLPCLLTLCKGCPKDLLYKILKRGKESKNSDEYFFGSFAWCYVGWFLPKGRQINEKTFLYFFCCSFTVWYQKQRKNKVTFCLPNWHNKYLHVAT